MVQNCQNLKKKIQNVRPDLKRAPARSRVPGGPRLLVIIIILIIVTIMIIEILLTILIARPPTPTSTKHNNRVASLLSQSRHLILILISPSWFLSWFATYDPDPDPCPDLWCLILKSWSWFKMPDPQIVIPCFTKSWFHFTTTMVQVSSCYSSETF